jgi:glycogen synthase
MEDWVRVVRICSVFEPPAVPLDGRIVRFDPVGGMQNHASCFSRELDRLGVHQTILTTRPPGAPRTASFGEHGQVMRFGLPIPRFRQLYAAQAWPSVARVAGGADLIHAHQGEDLAVLPLARHAAKTAGVPLIVTVHTSLRHTLRVSDLRSWLLRAAGAPIETHGLRHAAAVITLTERAQRYLIADGLDPARVHVLPSAVAGDVTEPGAGPAAEVLAGIPRPLILYLGRLHPQKDVETLIKAMTHMTSRPGTLVVVGDGPDRARLERLAERLGLAGRVRFTGFVPHAEVGSVLRQADVMAVPSSYEELGSVVLEALSARVPVVATDIGGIPEVIRHRETGLLVPPRDPATLASAIAEVLADSQLRDQLVSRAQAFARRYRIGVLAPRLLRIYEDVATAHTARATEPPA